MASKKQNTKPKKKKSSRRVPTSADISRRFEKAGDASNEIYQEIKGSVPFKAAHLSRLIS